MESLLQELFSALQGQMSLGGWASVAGIAGVALSFALRVYRSAPIQGLLKPKWRWNSFGPFLKMLIPFLLAAIGAFLTGLAGAIVAGVAFGSVIGNLLATAIGAGIAAVFAHHVTKAGGTAIAMKALNVNPAYRPSPLRKKVSLAVPIDIDKARAALEKKKAAGTGG